MRTPRFRTERALAFAKSVLSGVIEAGDTVVDATMGNGHDTLFLAQAAGSTGTVYAFDIQQAALEATRDRLSGMPGTIRLILDSHARMERYVPSGAAAVMFNLGFLPNAEDDTVITTEETTVPALAASLRLLKPGGILSVAVYDGHPGGAEERDAVLEFARSLESKEYQVLRYETVNTRQRPPFLLLIEKSARG